MRRRFAFPALVAVGALFVLSLGGSAGSATAPVSCSGPAAAPGYAKSVRAALLAKRDLWGNRLLASRNGPTYEAASRYLEPLLFAEGRGGRPLTTSGVYYLPFSFPFSVYAAVSALHVADGSEIISRRVGGPSLTVSVGSNGRERYGSCLGRLAPAQLADGYLPILDTAYVDRAGVRYQQESFVSRVFGSTSSVSFVHLNVDASASPTGAVVRLVPSVHGLAAVGNRLVAGKRTQLLFSAGGTFNGSAVVYAVAAGAIPTSMRAGRPVDADPRPRGGRADVRDGAEHRGALLELAARRADAIRGSRAAGDERRARRAHAADRNGLAL